ncbi:MAG: NusG domain II-containing protein [Candidatus Atribacteria bacterium]|nr:NusG domain II-containing protein [Candidatus Atribacteria bacterium]
MKPSWKNRLLALFLFGIALVGIMVFFRFHTKAIGSYRLVIKNFKNQQEVLVNDETNSVLMIEGPLGMTEVHIHQGKVWVSHSPCPDKLCIHMGKIPDNGGFIACLPNRVIIRAILPDE